MAKSTEISGRIPKVSPRCPKHGNARAGARGNWLIEDVLIQTGRRMSAYRTLYLSPSPSRKGFSV